MSAAADDELYTEDAIHVGITIFGAKSCSCCGAELAANHDYFAPLENTADGLSTNCRRCRRRSSAASYARRRCQGTVTA